MLCIACDPYPSVKWYNASRNALKLQDGGDVTIIPAGGQTELIPGMEKEPWIIVGPSGRREYRKVLPLPTSGYAAYQTWTNKELYFFLVLPDLSTLAIPADRASCLNPLMLEEQQMRGTETENGGAKAKQKWGHH